MPTEAFYATTAQIITALLIAFSLELGFVLRRLYAAALGESRRTGAPPSMESLAVVIVVALGVVGHAVAGLAGALAMLSFRDRLAHPLYALAVGHTGFVAVVVMVLVVVALPVLVFLTTADQQSAVSPTGS